MTLSYTRASLELCLDLTSPGAESMPVGALVLGRVGDERYAALATSRTPASDAGDVDPLTRDLLMNIFPVLKKKLSSAMERTGFDLDRILEQLNASMQGSIHVGRIEQPQSELVVEGSTSKDIAMRLMNIAVEHLDDAASGIRFEGWPLGSPGHAIHAK